MRRPAEDRAEPPSRCTRSEDGRSASRTSQRHHQTMCSGTSTLRRAVLCLRRTWRAADPSGAVHVLLPATRSSVGCSEDSVPRSSTYARNARITGGGSSKSRKRTTRPLNDHDHARHLQSRLAEYAAGGSGGRRRTARHGVGRTIVAGGVYEQGRLLCTLSVQVSCVSPTSVASRPEKFVRQLLRAVRFSKRGLSRLARAVSLRDQAAVGQVSSSGRSSSSSEPPGPKKTTLFSEEDDFVFTGFRSARLELEQLFERVEPIVRAGG